MAEQEAEAKENQKVWPESIDKESPQSRLCLGVW